MEHAIHKEHLESRTSSSNPCMMGLVHPEVVQLQ